MYILFANIGWYDAYCNKMLVFVYEEWFRCMADEIVCIDSSRSRLNRLKDTFRWYVPGSMDGETEQSGLALRLRVIQEDARVMGDIHPDRYDKVGGGRQLSGDGKR